MKTARGTRRPAELMWSSYAGRRAAEELSEQQPHTQVAARRHEGQRDRGIPNHPFTGGALPERQAHDGLCALGREIGDVFVVNKADRKGSDRTVLELERAGTRPAGKAWRAPAVKTAATIGEEIAAEPGP
ncbi:MAG TPA: hypothetical protein GXX40_01465 [Firmicutes bacterium]|nr:hypothetical protein [Bacillota bacterium]